MPLNINHDRRITSHWSPHPVNSHFLIIHRLPWCTQCIYIVHNDSYFIIRSLHFKLLIRNSIGFVLWFNILLNWITFWKLFHSAISRTREKSSLQTICEYIFLSFYMRTTWSTCIATTKWKCNKCILLHSIENWKYV